jgi:DNA polymerase III subunit delta
VKLSGTEAARGLAKPDAARAGILLYGPDPMLVALTRQALVDGLIGAEGAAEMRLERIEAGELRRDPARLGDALRARGFFPGHRVVLVEDATEAVAAAVLDALAGRGDGDAELLVTAGALPARSSLRKGFEAARAAVAVALYPDPPGRAEIAARLARLGRQATPAGMEALEALGAVLDPGEFAQTLEKLSLYLLDPAGPADEADVAAVAPAAPEGEIDEILHLVAEGEAAAVGPQLKRLSARGSAATSLVIAAARHFRALHAAVSAPGGVEAGLAAMRPPVFGPRRARMAAQARRWGQPRTERALALLTDTDLALRSSRPVPALALVERAFIRIAMMARS